MFKEIPDCTVLLRVSTGYMFSKVFAFKESLYFKQGNLYYKIMRSNITSKSNIQWVNIFDKDEKSLEIEFTAYGTIIIENKKVTSPYDQDDQYLMEKNTK